MIDMNKQQIIKILKQYNFDSKEYIVISGAAMVLLGIKESTNDIDIAVTSNYYNYLLSKYECILEIINQYGVKVYFIDNIINFSTSYYSKNKIFIDNIPVQSIQDIVNLKSKLNREKDKKDMKLIEEFINE